MLDEPKRKPEESDASLAARREVWAKRPVFRSAARDQKPERMDQSSYKKAWAAAVAVAVKAHPELAGELTGARLRDLRASARTFWTDNGIHETTIRALLGHSGGRGTADASSGYYRVTDPVARRAVLLLTLPKDEEKKAAAG